jgi:hypothetical protein
MDAARGYQGANSETGPMGRFLFIHFYPLINLPVENNKRILAVFGSNFNSGSA